MCDSFSDTHRLTSAKRDVHLSRVRLSCAHRRVVLSCQPILQRARDTRLTISLLSHTHVVLRKKLQEREGHEPMITHPRQSPDTTCELTIYPNTSRSRHRRPGLHCRSMGTATLSFALYCSAKMTTVRNERTCRIPLFPLLPSPHPRSAPKIPTSDGTVDVWTIVPLIRQGHGV